jgi:hypothetical protein
MNKLKTPSLLVILGIIFYFYTRNYTNLLLVGGSDGVPLLPYGGSYSQQRFVCFEVVGYPPRC